MKPSIFYRQNRRCASPNWTRRYADVPLCAPLSSGVFFCVFLRQAVFGRFICFIESVRVFYTFLLPGEPPLRPPLLGLLPPNELRGEPPMPDMLAVAIERGGGCKRRFIERSEWSRWPNSFARLCLPI